MADGDAEWIDFEKEFGHRSTVRPRPHFPRTSTRRPYTPRIPPTNRPPRRFPRPSTLRPFVPRVPDPGHVPNPPHDAADKMPPVGIPSNSKDSTKTTVVAVSVVSVFLLVGLASLLVYLLFLRKKLNKVKSTTPRDDYSIRIEDIAHIELTDSDNVYVNTTDIQKLVSTMKSSKKEKALNNITAGGSKLEEPYKVSNIACNIPNAPKIENIMDNPVPIRQAPPPPTLTKVHDIKPSLPILPKPNAKPKPPPVANKPTTKSIPTVEETFQRNKDISIVKPHPSKISFRPNIQKIEDKTCPPKVPMKPKTNSSNQFNGNRSNNDGRNKNISKSPSKFPILPNSKLNNLDRESSVSNIVASLNEKFKQ